MRLHRVIISAVLISVALVQAPAAQEQEGPPPVKGTPIQTPSGLQYYEVEKGIGSPVWRGMRVKVHYTGYLQSTGQIFDSSLKTGRPLAFVIGSGTMIRGFDEGITGMRVGGKRRLIIPPELGYGKEKKKEIPPNSTLIFDVELAGIG